MSIQFMPDTAIYLSFAFAFPPTDHDHCEPIQASSGDYGFDFDEGELAVELLAPLPASLADLLNPQVEADDFESLYRWFNS